MMLELQTRFHDVGGNSQAHAEPAPKKVGERVRRGGGGAPSPHGVWKLDH